MIQEKHRTLMSLSFGFKKEENTNVCVYCTVISQYPYRINSRTLGGYPNSQKLKFLT